jgi:hypothetical protein
MGFDQCAGHPPVFSDAGFHARLCGVQYLFDRGQGRAGQSQKVIQNHLGFKRRFLSIMRHAYILFRSVVV